MKPTIIEVILVPGLLVVSVDRRSKRVVRQYFRHVNKIHFRSSSTPLSTAIRVPQGKSLSRVSSSKISTIDRRVRSSTDRSLRFVLDSADRLELPTEERASPFLVCSSSSRRIRAAVNFRIPVATQFQRGHSFLESLEDRSLRPFYQRRVRRSPSIDRSSTTSAIYRFIFDDC